MPELTSFHKAQQLASRFPPLMIEADRVAETVWQGVHGRRRAGIGETFWQFRPYVAGDPVARIDWRQSARSEKIYIREREWEASQTVALWVDSSGSMRYQSTRSFPSKLDRGRLLALAFASLVLRGGEKVLWMEEQQSLVASGRSGLETLATALLSQLHDRGRPPLVPLPRHAHALLVSDFLADDPVWQEQIHAYAAFGLKGLLLHILDPMEEDFSFQGRLEVRGCEEEGHFLLSKAETVRAEYQNRLKAHQEKLERLARSAGWLYIRHVTRQRPEMALMQIYTGLLEQK